MRVTRQSGSEGGARFNPSSLPLSAIETRFADLTFQRFNESRFTPNVSETI